MQLWQEFQPKPQTVYSLKILVELQNTLTIKTIKL